MTSTPVSLDESLNGSWIDINSASQIHSPMDDDSPELLGPPYSLAESVQNLGLISFQVERFLQEAQRNQNNSSSNSQLNLHQSTNATISCGGGGGLQQQPPCPDDISGIYTSDSEISIDGLDGKTLINSLRRHNQQQQHYQQQKQMLKAGSKELNNQVNSRSFNSIDNVDSTNPRLSKSGGDCLVDQLSDSLSLLSRTSAFGNRSNFEQQASNFQDLDWLWDWTPQPEYFTGQEWKVYAPKQDYLMRQRQLYCGDLDKNHPGSLFSSEVMSLLFLTNILSIIIGAGLTYSILIRRSNL